MRGWLSFDARIFVASSTEDLLDSLWQQYVHFESSLRPTQRSCHEFLLGQPPALLSRCRLRFLRWPCAALHTPLPAAPDFVPARAAPADPLSHSASKATP